MQFMPLKYHKYVFYLFDTNKQYHTSKSAVFPERLHDYQRKIK